MEMKQLTVRDAAALDALIAVIEETLPNEAFWLPLDKVAHDHFFDPAWTEFWGMFDGDRLVAASALFFNEYEYGDTLALLGGALTGVAEIGRCMVHPDYRGNGLMYRLNCHLAEVARDRGYACLLATVHPDNLPSRRTFEKMGFENKLSCIKHGTYPREVYLLPLK